jgi:hypothetical protein
MIEETPPKAWREVTDFANPDCIRSNCTLHRSDFLGRQMPRGIVHALDRYYLRYINSFRGCHSVNTADRHARTASNDTDRLRPCLFDAL